MDERAPVSPTEIMDCIERLFRIRGNSMRDATLLDPMIMTIDSLLMDLRRSTSTLRHEGKEARDA